MQTSLPHLGQLRAMSHLIINSVSLHAPKRLHFSGSSSLEGRVAFAVTTKNSGKSTVCKVQ